MHSTQRTKWIISVFFIFLFIQTHPVFCDSNEPDTLTVEKSKSPMGAVFRSALVPGWGQLYSEQPVRALVAFCGVLGLAGTAMYHNRMAVESRTDVEREFYLNNRSQAVWWCFGVYLLNMLDAYVDAHLWHFDTGPDLAFAVRSKPNRMGCLNLSWSF